QPDTLILETTFETATGKVVLTDFMPPRSRHSHLVRLVRGEAGTVEMQMELILRFGYGVTVPWVTRHRNGSLHAVAGPDLTVLRPLVPTRGEGLPTVAQFGVGGGEPVPFVPPPAPSHRRAPAALDVRAALKATQAFWRGWSGQSDVDGPYEAPLKRSLL